MGELAASPGGRRRNDRRDRRNYRVTPAAIFPKNGMEPKLRSKLDEADHSGCGAFRCGAWKINVGTGCAKATQCQDIADQYSVTTRKLKSGIISRTKSDARHGVARLSRRNAATACDRLQSAARSRAPLSHRKQAGGTLEADAIANTPPAAAKKPAAPVTHKVLAGETLWSIAQAYRTTADALRGANKFLFTRPLHVGDQLVILPPKTAK